MTNEEIKKALVLCQCGAVITCRKCPYIENCNGAQLLQDALDLITEQEQDIKQLKTECALLDDELRIARQETIDVRKETAKEIERLKAENKKYLDSIESVQAGRCRLICPLTEQAVKQAKIDVLNELKDKMFEREYMGVKYKERIFYESEINEMIAEVQNAEDKS